MHREYHQWYSPCLSREMELLVFGSGGARVLVLPAREGRFFDYERWGMVAALEQSINGGHIQLFCVDSVDGEGLYNPAICPQARLERYQQYESYLITEVLPFTARTNPDYTLIAHGCSLGAYHAVNLALRHPDKFGRVVAFSGRYDISRPIAHYRDLFDGYYSTDLYYQLPTHYLPRLTDDELLTAIRQLDIMLVIGEADPLLPNNRELSDALHSKGVCHQLILWDGEAHRPRAWRQMAPLYL